MTRAYYNCKTEIDAQGATNYRISKFDADLNVEASYLVKTDGALTCECPAGHRPSCRHRQMLPRFLAEGATNGQKFYDFEREQFIVANPYALHEQANDLLADLTPDTLERSQASASAPAPAPDLFAELASIPGVTIVSLDDPAKLFDTIAEAVGEPTLPETFPPSGLIRRL